ncbi:fimbria/pilus outer membrane usher protein [Acinetobacter sp. ANC 4648]|uniref:fimbria/pilus outer membrane usher protein n=1 Tax=Acinetobacter sp. ANC 4648 TaxID=1977875 RepID=UPI001D175F1F|nr:fimbria/pilus outer membrane usher protein [Acinetobacter sp. ANC 4648]
MHTDITLLKDQDRFYVECDVLKQAKIDISHFQVLQSKPDYCLVSGGEIQSTFDQDSQSIKVTVPASFFATNTYGSDIQQPEKASFGGFLNYEMHYANTQSDNTYNGLAELGIFKDYWIFKNSMFYQNLAEENKLVRLGSSIDYDFPNKMTRLTIGDTTTVYNPLINSLRFGGLSWGTNYTERPNFIYWNVPSLQGSARIPSTVELYINGVNIYNQKVTPGDYNLQTGAQIQQSGNAQIVVEDILGNRSVQSFPIIVTSQLLRKGLSEYNISLGKLRYNYNLDSSDYRDFFANTFYRKGISNSTSLGTNVLYSKDIQNVGLMWTQAVSNLFLLDSTIQSSHEDKSGFNFSYGLSASKDLGRYSLGLNSKYTERNFKFLGDDLNGDNIYPKFENLVYFGVSGIPVLQNVNINYAEQKYYNSTTFPRDNQKILRVGFSRQIGPKALLGLSYFNEMGDRKDSGGILSLSYNFDSTKTLYASQSANKNTNLQFVKSDANQVGFDYAVGANRRDNETLYNLDGVFKTNVGDLSFSHQQSNVFRESQLHYSGAIVLLENKLNFTKSVDNAFALVKVGSYPNIDILRALNDVSKTNKKGYAFVHDIIPYVKYDIAFDENQLPIEDKILYSNKQITALNQRGYVIDFPIYHAKQVTIRPLDVNGQIFTPGSEVSINNEDGDVYPVSSDGTVTLYGLIPKTYQLKIQTKEAKVCSAELKVTDTPTVAGAPPMDISCK